MRISVVAVAAAACPVLAFVPVPRQRTNTLPSSSVLFVAAQPPPATAEEAISTNPIVDALSDGVDAGVARVVTDSSKISTDSRNFVLSRDDVQPLVVLGSGDKEKVVNAFGLWCLFVSLITGPIWMLAMEIVQRMGDDGKDANRAAFDRTGKVWSKTWLTMINSYPTVSGNIERLNANNPDLGACLFVANHASWLDIPVLCTVLDPVFKFIAKGELSKVPCIGKQLSGGDHILIDRDDRKSQLRTFKEGIRWLKRGVPIMAFPEGQRSKDGRLMNFKGGLFLMAAKTQVPIVPITISHTHAVMPGNSLFPVQMGKGKLHVHVHEAIDTKGKTEEEMSQLVKDAFLETLPLCQHPIEVETKATFDDVVSIPLVHKSHV